MHGEWWHKYLRLPFITGGRTHEGVDCWGLVCLIYKQELGIELPSYSGLYDDTTDTVQVGKVYGEDRSGFASPIEAHQRQPFDVILLRISGAPMHVAICTKKQWMIHCSAGIGVSHEKIYGMRWADRVLGFYRHADRHLIAPAIQPA
jgi:cell wall-associated NlpC family hydrolase